VPVRLETTRLRPRRRQAAISVEAAARIATAMLIARSAESGIGTGSLKNTKIHPDNTRRSMRARPIKD